MLCLRDLEIPQALINRSEQIEGEHRRLLKGKQELLSSLNQQAAGGDRHSVSLAPVLWIYQCPHAERISRGDVFTAGSRASAQPHRAFEQAEHPITGCPGLEDRVAFGNLEHVTVLCQRTHDLQGGDGHDRRKGT